MSKLRLTSIEMVDGTIFKDPVVLWPRNWKNTDRAFMTIRVEEDGETKEIHVRRSAVVVIRATRE